MLLHVGVLLACPWQPPESASPSTAVSGLCWVEVGLLHERTLWKEIMATQRSSMWALSLFFFLNFLWNWGTANFSWVWICMSDDWHTLINGKEKARKVQYSLQKVQCYPHVCFSSLQWQPLKGICFFYKNDNALFFQLHLFLYFNAFISCCVFNLSIKEIRCSRLLRAHLTKLLQVGILLCVLKENLFF